MNRTDELLAAIELSLIPGVGRETQGKLRSLGSELMKVFTMNVLQLEALGVQEEVCRAILARRYRAMAEEILGWVSKEGCQILLRGDLNYPKLLAEIFDPPLLLYSRGNLEALDAPMISIVGTRRPTPYGLQMAQGLAADLASRGITIVSGLARGIDAAAHRGALQSGGRTIAVLGCGIDIVYPREHRRLSDEITQRGLILSEFAPGTSPSPQNFPVRNRIISGIALGTLIVEASEYSGSLITARLSMEQNREVFALPGNITAPHSFGPNFLIKQGAKLVQCWRDIVEEFPPELRRTVFSAEDARTDSGPQLEMLTAEETSLLGLLETDSATQFDKILRISGLEISKLSDLLTNLELRGWVRQLPGNLYFKVARPIGFENDPGRVEGKP